jgi:hypothetical protein
MARAMRATARAIRATARVMRAAARAMRAMARAVRATARAMRATARVMRATARAIRAAARVGDVPAVDGRRSAAAGVARGGGDLTGAVGGVLNLAVQGRQGKGNAGGVGGNVRAAAAVRGFSLSDTLRAFFP